MINFLKKLFGFGGDDIDNYEYNGANDVILKLAALRGLKRHKDAIRLYEKFEDQIKRSDVDLVGLTEIIKICDEIGDNTRKINYAMQLRNLAPDHPYVRKIFR